MPTRAMHSEKRRSQRSIGLEVVEIEISGCDERRMGIVRDKSDRGARIEVGHATSMPSRIIVFSPSIGDGVHARVCWRRDREIGIRFCKRLN